MDFNNLSNLGNIKDSIPDLSNIMGSLNKPDYEQSKEFGPHRSNGEFNALADYELPTLDIDSVIIRSGSIVDGIILTYADGSTIQHGGSGGGAYRISLKHDYIKRITGYSGVSFGNRALVSQLCIETGSGKKYGPFGSNRGGNQFEIYKADNKIVAFYGSTDGGYIASLGAYLMKV